MQTVSRAAISVVCVVAGLGYVTLTNAATPAVPETLAARGDPVAAAPASSAPIFQPGAPGQSSKPVTAAQSMAVGRSAVNPADVKFMQDMIEHHAQAVEMVELLKTRTSRPDMQLLGRRIEMSQSAEIQMMRSWLTRRGERAPDPSAQDMRGMTMTGMLSAQQMMTLAAAKGAEFDRLFLQGMIQHHRGALGMVSALASQPESGEDAALSDFLTSIVADQTAEIERMNAMLSGYSTHENN